MKPVTSSVTVKHLKRPVSVQVLQTIKPWQFLRRSIFLSVMAIQHFEEQGAFDEPAIYIIVAHKYGEYRLYKRKYEVTSNGRQASVP